MILSNYFWLILWLCFSPSQSPGNLCAIPVADIRGVDSVNYSKGEKMLRCKLGSLYRLADLHGWTQLIYNHISVSLSRHKMYSCLCCCALANVHYCCCKSFSDNHAHGMSILRGVNTRRVRKTFTGTITKVDIVNSRKRKLMPNNVSIKAQTYYWRL